MVRLQQLTRRSTLAIIAVVTLAMAAPLGAQYSDSFGKNKIQYRDFDWQIYHSPHFDVYYYESEKDLLEKVVSFAESAYDELSRAFDFQIQEPTPLIFYATHSAFEQNNIILNFIPEGVGAFASPVRNRMVLPADLPDPELLALIKHELTHIFQYHLLFQGSLAKGLASNPPLWLMEGLASFMAKDETTQDRMYLRDAVVNDLIPSITQQGVGGFFAYRFGHAAFEYIEERWGKDGLLDFLYEFRNTIGSRPDRALERALKIEGEDFDREFRQWLRKKYLPQLVETGEPGDFGRPFRIPGSPGSQQISAVASPSGDLVAAFAAIRGDLDIVLFDVKRRRLLANLTKGLATNYQYFSSQFLTSGRAMGRDLAFSPDGNRLAVFAKREEGRSLILIDVLKGGVDRIVDMVPLGIEQPLAPAFSADGRSVAFSGNRDNQFDIFSLNLETLEVTNLTNDAIYDGAPTFSPDGRWLAYTSVVGESNKLFRLDLNNPEERFQITTGDSNEVDAIYGPDGNWLYFTSDRDGVDNIYGMNLKTGEVLKYTDVVSGCFMPTVLDPADGERQLVYSGYWRGSFQLFVTDVDEPLDAPEAQGLSGDPVSMAELDTFEPDIQVAVDEANVEPYGGYKFFLENAEAFFGVDDNQTLLGQVILSWSDYLGDRRIIGIFASQDSLSNFDVRYLDLRNRWQWIYRLYDTQYFYTVRDDRTGERFRLDEAYEQIGAEVIASYPFSLKTRVQFSLGYVYREFAQQLLVNDPVTGGTVAAGGDNVTDDFPRIGTSIIHDGALFASYGPISGRRLRLDLSYSPDFEESGTLTSQISADYREYIPVTRRSNVAFRLYAGAAEGNQQGFFSFGGLDTVRGFEFRELSGDRVFFANLEFRFPLIDLLAFPIYRFQGIRGRVFFDVGGAWFDEFQEFSWFDREVEPLGAEDGVAAYGFGLSTRLFGLNVNWDFSKQYDFETSTDGFRTDFYIGNRF